MTEHAAAPTDPTVLDLAASDPRAPDPAPRGALPQTKARAERLLPPRPLPERLRARQDRQQATRLGAGACPLALDGARGRRDGLDGLAPRQDTPAYRNGFREGNAEFNRRRQRAMAEGFLAGDDGLPPETPAAYAEPAAGHRRSPALRTYRDDWLLGHADGRAERAERLAALGRLGRRLGLPEGER
ncbi:MAG: hypothetical protein WD341_06255 [Tistlia sp.]|uniref:hypothetical protein n=1 Tax=Tistlia sp. TaxID=3057121 RepID=UPI0034A1F53D